jgi:hypothetical protein
MACLDDRRMSLGIKQASERQKRCGIQKLTRKKKHPDGIRGCGILDHPSLKRKKLACLDSDDRRMSLGIKQATSNMANWKRQGGRGRESSCVMANLRMAWRGVTGSWYQMFSSS